MIYKKSEPVASFFVKPINLNIKDLNDYNNFNYIDSSIKDSRIIFLGESSHTSKEYSLVKYKLIKYLHEKHGFDVVLFESGIADCFYSNKIKNVKDSSWLLKNSIFPIWWCQTTMSMMNYLKNAQITFGGFDYQRSSFGYSEFLQIIPEIDTSIVNKLFKLDTAFSNFTKNNYPPLNSISFNAYKEFQKELEVLYKKFDEELDRKKDIIDSTNFKYYKRIISNKLFYINNFTDLSKRDDLRDSIMSDNLLWYIDNIYKNKKIIVWGANDHIAKHKSNISKNFYAASILPQRIKRESYFIGLFAYSGQMYANPSYFEIKTPKQSSMENRIHMLGGDNDVFLDLKHNYQKQGFTWLSKKTITYHWGKLIDKIVPVEFYDGIILINKTSLSREF